MNNCPGRVSVPGFFAFGTLARLGNSRCRHTENAAFCVNSDRVASHLKSPVATCANLFSLYNGTSWRFFLEV